MQLAKLLYRRPPTQYTYAIFVYFPFRNGCGYIAFQSLFLSDVRCMMWNSVMWTLVWWSTLDSTQTFGWCLFTNLYRMCFKQSSVLHFWYCCAMDVFCVMSWFDFCCHSEFCREEIWALKYSYSHYTRIVSLRLNGLLKAVLVWAMKMDPVRASKREKEEFRTEN